METIVLESIRRVDAAINTHYEEDFKQRIIAYATPKGYHLIEPLIDIFNNDGVDALLEAVKPLQRDRSFAPGIYRELLVLESRVHADYKNQFLTEKKEPKKRKKKRAPEGQEREPLSQKNPFASHTQGHVFHAIFEKGPYSVEEAVKIAAESGLKLTFARAKQLPYEYQRGDIAGFTIEQSYDGDVLKWKVVPAQSTVGVS